MKSNFKLGEILCERCSLKKPANQRYYYVVIQEETDDKYLVIQTINSNSLYASGTSINPTHPEDDLVVTELKASYLLHQEITVVDSIVNEPVVSNAIGYEGNNRIIMFTPVNDDLIGNVYYEVKSQKKSTVSGYLYCEFYRKEKFIK
ncbi:hypothetical protein ACFQZF_11230 [Flavobacterium myungsuense]|uniref:Uncharacterized protein n=1 Tax=Flavobacterium myungsuense TaxID=651823 RepID=A0ABW3J144_9FLAO